MKITRIGVPVKEGCCISGADKAISALQTSGMVFDEVIEVRPQPEDNPRMHYLNTIIDLDVRLRKAVLRAHDNGNFPLIFGGDHSLAIGSIGALDNSERAVLWIDAHGDCNTDMTTESKRIHGMPLAVLQGHGADQLTAIIEKNFVASKNILLVGIRSLDIEEEKLMHSWGLHWITMDETRNEGMNVTLEKITKFVSEHPALHVSFDCDSTDPQLFPGVSTAVQGGFTMDEALNIVNVAFDHGSVNSMDIVEFNPYNDNGATMRLVYALDKYVAKRKEG